MKNSSIPVTSEDDLDDHCRLAEASSARVICGAHVLSFQPADQPNEDRYFVEDWTLPNGRWKVLAIFDGHGAGTEAVDFVAVTLPSVIKAALSSLTDEDISNAQLAALLIKCIYDVDMRIESDFVALFPRDINELSQEDIRRAIQDQHSEDSRIEVLRARTGTTAIVALVDPKKTIHVASLGDCDAVLGTKGEAGWQTKILSARHNCANDSEVGRIRAEHPGEAECVNAETLRTLGLIAVTRAMGDMLFKLPAVYTERVAPLSLPPMHPNYDLQGLAARNITPPYLSNIAQVKHLALPPSDAQGSPQLLVMASDGLVNILARSQNTLSEAAPRWCAAAASRDQTKNMAVDVLWDACQRDDGESLYRSMVEGRCGRRIDDITIVVCAF
ncbi:protein serine/threonine phosphatase 2C [Mycena latifolia]|nr:protein serine/threonine phosphatase 2C [Mycena latifolia]